MSRLTLENLIRLKKVLGIEKFDQSYQEILQKYNETVCFAASSKCLYFKHREIFSSPSMISEGYSDHLEVKNLTVGASLYIDSREYEINYGDEFIIRPTEEELCLRTLDINQSEE